MSEINYLQRWYSYTCGAATLLSSLTSLPTSWRWGAWRFSTTASPATLLLRGIKQRIFALGLTHSPTNFPSVWALHSHLLKCWRHCCRGWCHAVDAALQLRCSQTGIQHMHWCRDSTWPVKSSIITYLCIGLWVPADELTQKYLSNRTIRRPRDKGSTLQTNINVASVDLFFQNKSWTASFRGTLSVNQSEW